MPSSSAESLSIAALGRSRATGYFFPVLKIFEISSGLMLLSGRFVPLALIFLAPISLQIFLFHAALAPGGLGLPILILEVGVWDRRPVPIFEKQLLRATTPLPREGEGPWEKSHS